MDFKIQTKSGRVYNRVAWMGGDTAPKTFRRISRDFRNLMSFFFREQIKDFKDYWGDMPDKDTRKIFWGRARVDSWASYRDKFGKTDNNLSSKI